MVHARSAGDSGAALRRRRLDRHRALRRLTSRLRRASAQPRGGSAHLELVLSIVAVAVALAWLVHGRPALPPASPKARRNWPPPSRRLQAAAQQVFRRRDSTAPPSSSRCSPSPSTFWSGWWTSPSSAALAWLLAGIATLAGAILQRWQSGNLRSYAAWLAARRRGAASFRAGSVGHGAGRSSRQFTLAWRGTERMTAINESILTLILLVPLAGAVLVALVPDRGKLPNWIALLTTLVSFRPHAASAGALRPRPARLPVRNQPPVD